jgi:hypothetical protein
VVQHLLGQASGGGVLLPQLNVSTPKRASREDGHNSISATIVDHRGVRPTTTATRQATSAVASSSALA